MTVFGRRLRAVLAYHRMTQSELGQHLGKTQTAVSYWTTGAREPNLTDLCKIADLLGVSTDALLGREPLYLGGDE